jgi:hypothetical protein
MVDAALHLNPLPTVDSDRPDQSALIWMDGESTVITAIGTGALALTLATSTMLTGAPPATPPGAVLEVLDFRGSGCAKEDTLVAQSPDKEAVTVTYANFIAMAGTEGEGTEASRYCGFTLKLTPPAGYAAAIANVDERGFARLDNGATASVQVRYMPEGATGMVRADEKLSSPTDDSWQTAHPILDKDLTFSKCGKPQMIGVVTKLTVGVGTAHPDTNPFAAIASTDFATNHFVWRKC